MKHEKKFFALIFTVLVISCSSESYTPFLYYKGDFESKNVDKLEKYIKNLALKNKYEIYEKDREQMRIVSDNADAFYISYHIDSGKVPVMWITNAGNAQQLVLGFNLTSDCAEDCVCRLSKTILRYLDKNMNVQMMKIDLPPVFRTSIEPNRTTNNVPN